MTRTVQAAIKADNVTINGDAAELVDRYNEIYDERAELRKRDKELTSEITELQAQILDLMNSNEWHSAVGAATFHRLTKSTKPVAQITDRDAFLDYMFENERRDFLQFRTTQSVVEELNLGSEIPGANLLEIEQISRTKIK